MSDTRKNFANGIPHITEEIDANYLRVQMQHAFKQIAYNNNAAEKAHAEEFMHEVFEFIRSQSDQQFRIKFIQSLLPSFTQDDVAAKKVAKEYLIRYLNINLDLYMYETLNTIFNLGLKNDANSKYAQNMLAEIEQEPLLSKHLTKFLLYSIEKNDTQSIKILQQSLIHDTKKTLKKLLPFISSHPAASQLINDAIRNSYLTEEVVHTIFSRISNGKNESDAIKYLNDAFKDQHLALRITAVIGEMLETEDIKSNIAKDFLTKHLDPKVKKEMKKIINNTLNVFGFNFEETPQGFKINKEPVKQKNEIAKKKLKEKIDATNQTSSLVSSNENLQQNIVSKENPFSVLNLDSEILNPLLLIGTKENINSVIDLLKSNKDLQNNSVLLLNIAKILASEYKTETNEVRNLLIAIFNTIKNRRDQLLHEYGTSNSNAESEKVLTKYNDVYILLNEMFKILENVYQNQSDPLIENVLYTFKNNEDWRFEDERWDLFSNNYVKNVDAFRRLNHPAFKHNYSVQRGLAELYLENKAPKTVLNFISNQKADGLGILKDLADKGDLHANFLYNKALMGQYETKKDKNFITSLHKTTQLAIQLITTPYTTQSGFEAAFKFLQYVAKLQPNLNNQKLYQEIYNEKFYENIIQQLSPILGSEDKKIQKSEVYTRSKEFLNKLIENDISKGLMFLRISLRQANDQSVHTMLMNVLQNSKFKKHLVEFMLVLTGIKEEPNNAKAFLLSALKDSNASERTTEALLLSRHPSASIILKEALKNPESCDKIIEKTLILRTKTATFLEEVSNDPDLNKNVFDSLALKILNSDYTIAPDYLIEFYNKTEVPNKELIEEALANNGLGFKQTGTELKIVEIIKNAPKKNRTLNDRSNVSKPVADNTNSNVPNDAATKVVNSTDQPIDPLTKSGIPITSQISQSPSAPPLLNEQPKIETKSNFAKLFKRFTNILTGSDQENKRDNSLPVGPPKPSAPPLDLNDFEFLNPIENASAPFDEKPEPTSVATTEQQTMELKEPVSKIENITNPNDLPQLTPAQQQENTGEIKRKKAASNYSGLYPENAIPAQSILTGSDQENKRDNSLPVGPPKPSAPPLDLNDFEFLNPIENASAPFDEKPEPTSVATTEQQTMELKEPVSEIESGGTEQSDQALTYPELNPENAIPAQSIQYSSESNYVPLNPGSYSQPINNLPKPVSNENSLETHGLFGTKSTTEKFLAQIKKLIERIDNFEETSSNTKKITPLMKELKQSLIALESRAQTEDKLKNLIANFKEIKKQFDILKLDVATGKLESSAATNSKDNEESDKNFASKKLPAR